MASLLVAALTGAAGAVAGGAVAAWCVDWYRISSREGLSGFFVVGVGLVGLLAGLVIGLVVARLVAGSASPGLPRALALSLGVVVALAGAIAGSARALADVAPEIAGEPLWLAVEVRLPASQAGTPALAPGEARLELHSVGRLSHTSRARREGVLWPEDARQVDGRWVVPGIVEVFTSRGRRMLAVVLGGQERGGFVVPLPARPGPREQQWSDWLPRWPGEAPADALGYRFAVVRRSEVVRRESVGPFEVATVVRELFRTAGATHPTLCGRTELEVRHRGRPVVVGEAAGEPGPRGSRADAVLVVAAARSALLAHVQDESEAAGTWLLVEEGGAVRATRVLGPGEPLEVREVPVDASWQRARREREPAPGWLDRLSLDHEGVFAIGGTAVLDSRRLAVHAVTRPEGVTPVPTVAPLGLSPEGRSLVWFAWAEGLAERPVLVVSDLVAGRASVVPLDPGSAPFGSLDELDAAWLHRHFHWREGGDGASLEPGEAAPATP